MKHRQKQGRKNLRGAYGTGKGQSTISRYTIGSKQELGVEGQGLSPCSRSSPRTGLFRTKVCADDLDQWAVEHRAGGEQLGILPQETWYPSGCGEQATKHWLRHHCYTEIFGESPEKAALPCSDSTSQKSWEGCLSLILPSTIPFCKVGQKLQRNLQSRHWIFLHL